MMKKAPLVSVCCITYNQEKFIRQTLDGFVMQKTNFPFEVVISDDCSKDSTRQIIAEYREKYPDIFRDVSPKQNMGSMENFFYSQEQAHGKYIAMCEGDDYWIDPLKLQKQVDFLESHPEYVICFHKVQCYINDIGEFKDEYLVKDMPGESNIIDLSVVNYLHTPSVMFRVNRDIYPIIHSFGHFLPDDYVCWMLTARYGKIYKMPDVMAVYRVGSGIWSTSTTVKNDLLYLGTLNKLYVAIDNAEVRANLQKQINGIIEAMTHMEKDLHRVQQSKAYRIGKAILKSFKWLCGV